MYPQDANHKPVFKLPKAVLYSAQPLPAACEMI